MAFGVEVVPNIQRPDSHLGRNSLSAFLIAVIFIFALALPSNAIAARYAGMAVDGHTGKVLYARNSNTKRYPASLTKIMTLYLLFDLIAEGKIDTTTDFYVTKHASSQAPSKLGLKPGQTIRAIDAIRALVTKSANDVAVVVAENIAGSEVNFAKLMTKRAREIGMRSTTFRNASGLPNKEQVTTARDMITLAIRIQRDHPTHYKYFKIKEFRYKGKRYRNHNSLLYSYKGTDGIKTGYTRASGFNLTSSVRRNGKHVVAVVLGGKSSKSRNAQMRRVLDKSLRRASVVKKSRPKPPAARRKPAAKPLPMVKKRPPSNGRTRHASVEPAIHPDELAQIEDALAEERRRGDVTRTSAIAASSPGDFHIQVGAYKSVSDASHRLDRVKTVAGDLLSGHDAMTMPFRARKRALYRARFAGFSKTGARAACSRLKSRDITCVVMRAE